MNSHDLHNYVFIFYDSYIYSENWINLNVFMKCLNIIEINNLFTLIILTIIIIAYKHESYIFYKPQKF